MYKVNQKIKIPLTASRYPCWDLSSFSGEAASTVVGKIISVGKTSFVASFTREGESRTTTWTFYNPGYCSDWGAHPGTYPTVINDDIDVVIRTVCKHGFPSEEETKKAAESAASYIRRTYRSWPYNKKLAYIIDQNPAGEHVIDFYFESLPE